MEYKHARYNSLLNKIINKDKLFTGDYTLDPYQNCEYGCIYCDSTLDETIYIKTNATQLLKKELEKNERGTIIVGSVSDPYQEAEKKYKTTRNLLKIIEQYDFPCHVLTKSNLVLKDIDVLSKIKNCTITISIISLDKSVSDIFEKKVPLPKERLQTVKKLSERGIKTGLAVIPILPFIVEEELENIVKSASKYKAHHVLHRHLELKGDQKNIFTRALEEFYPHLVKKYEKLYGNSYKPDQVYISKINDIVKRYCKNYGISNKI